MEVKWSNVALFALVIVALIVGIQMREQISAFFGCMGSIGPAYTTQDKMWGLMAFGLIAVLILGILKILAERDHRD
jgi:hypothetical protein